MDYYAVLDLDVNCTEEEVKAQYRRLALQHHPDVNPGNEEASTARLRWLNEAYEVLSDPVKRRVYDLTVDKPAPHSSRTRQDASASPHPAAPDSLTPRMNPYTGAVADARRRAERRMAVAAVMAGAFLILFVARSSKHLPPIQVPNQLVTGIETDDQPPSVPFQNSDNNDEHNKELLVNAIQNAMTRMQPQLDRVVEEGQNISRLSNPATDDNNRQSAFNRVSEELVALQNAEYVCKNDINEARTLEIGPLRRMMDKYRMDFLAMRSSGESAARDIQELSRAGGQNR